MKFFLFFFILFYSYDARTDFLTNEQIKRLKDKHGVFAANRFIALNKLVLELQDKDEITKVEKVNRFFNQVSYKSDLELRGVIDYWATPIEFLVSDAGDCEDFVIAKYFVLLHLDILPVKLYFTYVKLKKSNEAHMVLTYFPTPTSEPLVLDSIKKNILPASRRNDLIPVLNFNPKIIKSRKIEANTKWDEVLKRFKEQKK